MFRAECVTVKPYQVATKLKMCLFHGVLQSLYANVLYAAKLKIKQDTKPVIKLVELKKLFVKSESSQLIGLMTYLHIDFLPFPHKRFISNFSGCIYY